MDPTFPSVGVWEIEYTDDYAEGEWMQTVCVVKHYGDYKLKRVKVKGGWQYRLGEMNHVLQNHFLHSETVKNLTSPLHPSCIYH